MGHVSRARAFLEDEARTTWHDEALWFVRAKRDRAADLVPDWEALRIEAASIKREALGRLPDLWRQFEAEATRAGAVVHWARDAAEHNEIVAALLRDYQIGFALLGRCLQPLRQNVRRCDVHGKKLTKPLFN